MEVENIRFIRIKDDIFNLKEVNCIYKAYASDIGVDFRSGDGRIVEFNSMEERDEAYEKICQLL